MRWWGKARYVTRKFSLSKRGGGSNVLVDIHEARRRTSPRLHRKGKSMCLLWFDVRILTKKDDFNTMRFAKIKSCPNILD